MSGATATGQPIPAQMRVVGATALALVASMVIQNVVVGVAGAPDYAAPIDDAGHTVGDD